MRVLIAAVGRMKSGPEQSLTQDYLTRFDRTGKGLGLGPAWVQEVDERKAPGRSSQTAALRKLVSDNALLVVLDERGTICDSRAFAAELAGWRDAGRRNVVFVIGGAEGLDTVLIERADFSLSLGKMVWPHMLTRVMLAEQLYRAATILAGTPYHRD